MHKSIFRNLLLFSVLVTGPALALCMASDRLLDENIVFRFFNSYYNGFYVASIFGYAAASVLAHSHVKPTRAIWAVVASLIAFAVGTIITFPLHFGLGINHYDIRYGLLLIQVPVALLTATAQHFTLRTGRSYFIEAAAHLIAAIAPTLVFGAFSTPKLVPPFSNWPALFALLPFAIILATSTKNSFRPSALFFAFFFAVLPVYSLKVCSDILASRGNPLLWPIRIASDFNAPKTPFVLEKRVSWSSKSITIRLGKHSYRFANFALRNSRLINNARPRTFTSLQIKVPAKDLGFYRNPNFPFGAIRLYVQTSSAIVPKGTNRNGNWLTVAYEDLRVTMLSQKGNKRWPSDEVIATKLTNYFISLRVRSPSENEN